MLHVTPMSERENGKLHKLTGHEVLPGHDAQYHNMSNITGDFEQEAIGIVATLEKKKKKKTSSSHVNHLVSTLLTDLPLT